MAWQSITFSLLWVLSQLPLAADLYDRNKYGLDWKRDDAYDDQNPHRGDENQPHLGNYEYPRHPYTRPASTQKVCPCDPGDPECPCEIDAQGNYHRVD